VKGLLLAAASSLLCVAAVTVVFRVVDVPRRAAAMLGIFLATIPLYVAAYALTPTDLWLLPERLVEPRGFLDCRQQPFAKLARTVLAIPVERRAQRRVIPIGDRRLLLAELRLRTDVGTHRRRLLVNVRLRRFCGRATVTRAGASTVARFGHRSKL